MSPILVRPVREQLEHDRIIRQLQARFRRRFEVAINPGVEQNMTVGSAGLYPDLVLMSPDRGRKPQAVIEVETGESVNHLEALAQWSHFGRLRTAFHLYVPSNMVEVARRLCSDNAVVANEIWTYHGVGDDVRFTLVHRTKDSHGPSRSPSQAAGKPAAARRPAVKGSGPSRPKPKPKAKKTAKPSRPAKAVRAVKTVRKPVRGLKRR